MPKKIFIKIFSGNETNINWFIKEKNLNQPWSKKLQKIEEKIFISTKKLSNIEKETGLTIEEVKDINKRMSIGEAKAKRAKKEIPELCSIEQTNNDESGTRTHATFVTRK